MQRFIKNQKANRSRGVLKLEAMIAMVMLVTMINVASVMIHRINRLWSDAQQHQFAINELSNQMDALVRLPLEEAKEAIESISVSQACKETLGDPTMLGELSKDELGNRVTLKLTWKQREYGEPVELCGWLQPSKAGERAK